MDKLKKTIPADHAEWLELRRGGVGGSDAAAVIGCNQYSGPYEVWLDKLGRLPEKEPSEAMRLGTDLEAYVASRFTEETGKRVRRMNGVLRNPKYPFALADIDRWVIGENAGLECKTTSTLNYKKFKDGEFPANYYVQCMHYMAVTGADKWYLAVLLLGKDFLVFEFDRDEEFLADLMAAEEAFWDCVVKGIPPEVDGTDSTDWAISTQYGGGDGGDADLFGVDFESLMELKREKKEIDSKIKRIEQEAKVRLGDCETGHTDKFRVSWKNQTRRVFDHKRFALENPEMDLSPYYKESVSRVFRVKEV